MAASSRSVKRVKLFNTLDHTLFCRALEINRPTVSYGGLVIQFAREISPRVNSWDCYFEPVNNGLA